MFAHLNDKMRDFEQIEQCINTFYLRKYPLVCVAAHYGALQTGDKGRHEHVRLASREWLSHFCSRRVLIMITTKIPLVIHPDKGLTRVRKAHKMIN